MIFYDCDVNLAGDRNHVVRMTAVTAAELMVLQAIHGAGSVHSIGKTKYQKGRDNTPHEVVRDHLMKRYGKTRVGPDSDPRPVLVTVFPGWPNVTLPSDASKAGIDALLFREDEQPKKSGGRKAPAAAATDDADNSFVE